MTALASSIPLLWLQFFFYCVIGWVIESTYCSIPAGHFINRGFMNGPYLPIYGSGAMAALALFGELTNPVVIFLIGGTLCCALEWVTSWAMEKLYHARWWDYSDKPLNLNGRIWAGGFVEFGAAIVVALLIVNPPVLKFLERIPATTALVLALVTFSIFAVDLVLSHNGAIKMRDAMDRFVEEARTKATELATEAREQAEIHKKEAIEQTKAAVAETRAGAEAMTAQLQELAGKAEEAREKAEQWKLRAAERASLSRTEDWGQALDWSFTASLRSEWERRRANRPDLPQIAALEKVSQDLRERIGFQGRRMIDAFPGLKPTHYHELSDELAKQFTSGNES